MAPELEQAIREARDKAMALAHQAAETIECEPLGPGGHSDSVIESALYALEDSRNELLRIQVMREHETVVR
jgi:hypothetical protein